MSVVTGTSSNDNLNGGSGDDIMSGGAGSDTMSGGSGSDVMDGGSGSDRLTGGSGNDTLNGGSGSDTLNGDSGNDTLIYTLVENTGATDVYTGGSGIDIVRLQLTSAEWVRADVQTQIARYVQHLQTVKANQNTGEVSNGAASDFTFVFNGSSRLTVQMMERLEIWVDGQPFDFHAPFITVADGAGAVTEDSGPATLSDSGTINFLDVDWTQSHSATVAPNGGNTLGGTLTASVTNSATGDGSGVVTWTYNVANSATQYLGAGQTVTETFTVTITDSAGLTDTQTITVTVTGTNDAPTISAADASGAVTEDAASPTLADSGTITFDDVDLTDAHITSVAADGGNSLGGVLTAVVSDAATGAGDGTVAWDYSVANSAVQYLAAGQTASETFTVTIADGNGGTVDQLITITVTGTNDAPTISAADASGAVTEDAASPTLADSGTITFDDVDLTDAHITSVAADGGNSLGGVLTAVVSDAATGAGDGTVAWDYSVANSAVQYLAAGQTASETFTVTIADGNGGTVDQLITITVTGTNDAPTISAADASGAVTEDAASPTLADSGTITFDDVDLTDAHITSVAADGGNSLGGVLTAVVSDAATGAGDGTVAWDYSVANSAVQYLAAGQTASETFTVTIADGNGGTVDQLITITVTGTNDAPTISAADASGAVTEDAASPTLADSGTITFDDVDLTDAHITSVAADGGNSLGGVLTAVVSDAATGAGDGTVAWDYSVANSAVQYLAAGQTASETFTVTIADGNGGTVDQLITITVTGTNDAPTISAADASGAVTEDAASPTLADSGTITFDDVDLTDAHITSVAADGGNSLGGVLTAVVSDAATGAGDGTVAWDYSVANSAVQYLAAGQTASETFTVTIADGNGGTVDQLITITVTGTNDAPTISAADASGAVTEDAASPTLADSGTITFDDVDLTDAHITSVAADGGNSLGGVLTAVVSDAATGAGDGTVAWDYSVANSAVQYLAAGQTASETFTVTIADGNGGTVDQLITITVTGTNDAPTISAADASGAVTEDAASPTLADSGTITFDDVDLTDAHITSVAADGGNSLGGVLTAVVSDAATGAGDGTVAWDYSVANSAVQYLAAGQTASETFTVTIADGNGGTVDQLITITVTGTNDAPTISAADASGAVTEDAASPTLADSGTITFDDVDLTDAHITSVAADGGNSLGGVLTAVVSDAATGAGDGTVAWDYSVANSAVQYLAAGQTASETFTVTIADGNGGTVDQLITITVTGTNDAPTISAADASGAVTEDAASPTLADSGTITFDDVDLTDAHITSVAADGGNSLGGVLTAVVSDAATGAGDGTVAWDYSVANSAVQYLAAGQTASETFTVTIADGNGGTVDQLITITVTGTNDAPTISAADASGAVTEDAASPTLADSGTITFDDVDLTDAHITSVAADGGNSLGGVLTAVVSDAATGAGDGTVAWDYSVANSAVQYLAAGQTASETFTVTIADGNGGTVDQLITITVTGTNDAPTISAADASGAVTEDAASPTLADSGTITFDDVDLTDAHITSVAADGGNSLGGVLTAVVSDAATGAGDGTVAWDYSVANSAVQYLAAGQTASETFTVTIADGNGGTVDQLITITVTGTNDAPTISAADASGAVTEDAASPTLADSGTITFDDVDLTDAHITSVAADGGNSLGGVLTAVVSDAATGAGDGTVAWDYSVANSAVQYLAAGQTASETFTVTIADGNGGTVDQLITITVTGTNDAPTISAADASGAVTEDAASPTLADSGTITFDDVDLTDAHITSVAADGGNSLGGVLTAVVSDAATGAGDGTVAWDYSVANSAVQYLAAGQTASETFTVTIADGNGGTVDQLITITVTGTNDAPTISAADASGAVTEDAASPTLADSGTITFDDVDLTDAHITSVAADGGNSLGGVLTAVVSDAATGAGDGTVAWDYSVANSAVQYLAAGQTASETFTVTIADGNGGTVDQLITITVTGTNDAPTISAADASGAVTEDAASPTLADSGTITFDDVDLTDAHITSVAADGGNSLGGVLTAVVSDAATGAGDGTVAWDYSVANSAVQYLAAGQTASETFTVTIADGNGGTVDQLITITVTGTNDAPTISAADASGAVTEDAASPTLADSGTITFDDVDLTDAHITSVAADGGNSLGGVLTAVVSDAATGAGDGTVAWDYSVANSAVQYLAAGQTASETFTVTIADGNGGTVDQLITITVTGTNDAPTISAADASGAVTEDAASPTLADSGTITFDDVDLTDAHITSVAADGGNSLGGVLTAVVSDAATGAGDGTVAWDYSVANSAVQYLAAGQTASETFTVTIADGNGGTVDQLITITVTGTNDAPTISAADASGAVTEDAASPTLADSGTITFDDVDLTDAHITSVAADGGNSLGGVLTAVVSDAATGAGDGTVAWDYSVANSAVQYLAAGQTASETFTVTIADGNGGTVDQLITITVTGTNDAPTISAADASGAVTEDAASPTLADSGTITFDDVDLTDAHITSVAADGGNSLGGVLTAVVSDAATGAGDGTVAWDYSVANSAVQYLAAGQTASETFTVTIADGNGGTVDQLITITVTGTNDAPTISAADASGAVTEDAASPTLADSGTITFDDVDLTDAHITSVAADGGNSLGGVLTAVVSDAATGAGDGTVAWDYSVANSAVQYLAAGQTASETFTVTIADGNGGTVDQLITITVTGTNDAPTISAADASGAVTEDAASPTLADSGTITFDDVDLTDAHITSVAADGGNSLGGVLTAVVSDAATGAGDGTVAWDYSVANSAVQYLAAGQTASETFTVTIADGNGGTVDQLITITVTGTNDAPTISAADASGAVTEDAASPTLADSGTITFDDVDLTDAHITSVAADGGNSLGGVLTAVVSDAATGAGDGTVAWDYSVANSAVQYLAAGQTASETFTVTIADGNGGTVDQLITITVTGTNDAPTISAADASGAVTEDAASPTLADSGTITFDDVDLTDAHITSVAADGGNSLGGVLTAVVSDAATGAGDGTVAWDYSVANSAVQYLAAGQTASETFTVTIADGNGGTVDQLITITVTGTNDAPTISAADASGAVTEDAASPTLADSGTITFDDVDLTDAHITSVAADGGNSLGGVLTAVVSDAATGAGDGTVAWDYSVANSAVQYLAAGQTASETFTVTIADGNGGTVDQLITITVTGTNDAPTISAADASGAVTEDAASPTLADSGTITFDDVDLTDAHITSVAADGGNSLGGVLTAVVSDAATGAGDGTVAWDYSVANSAVQYLAAGQTASETFTVTIADGNGGTVDQLITITVTGTNDAPVLNAAATPVLASVAEDAGAPVGAVGTLVSALANLNPPAGGLDNVTDADNGALTGIAITDTNDSNGTWWFSTNGGTSWTQVAAVSDASALLLAADANTRVYFQGDSNFNGTVSDGITFRAWDRTSGTAGTYVSTATNGGSSAFSSTTDTAAITVTAVDDNPIVIGDRIIVSNSTLVTIPVSALLGNDTDIDGISLTITSVGSATGITGLTLNANGTISFTSGATAGATAGSFQYTVSDGAGGTATGTVTIDIRTVGTGNGGDTVDLSTAGTYQTSYLDGRGGADNLTGGAAGDIFIGGTGNGADTLIGSNGNDLLVGGDGNDTLTGGAGNDTLRGGLGNNDSMNGGAGSEDLLDFSDGTVGVTFTLVQSAGSTNIANGTGGLGNNDTYTSMEGVVGTSLGDTLTGSASNDVLRGGGGNDTLNGAGGTADLIDFSDGTAGLTFTLVNNGAGTVFNAGAAGLGTDTYSGIEGVIGTGFNDTITGSASADQLRGSGGNDVISGLAGDDRIVGGAGADTLTGGADNDTFVFDSAPNAVDSITDFDASETAASQDDIELSLAIFSGLTTPAGSNLSASEFASSDGGGAADSVGAGVRVIYDSATGSLYYDSDGGSSANRTLFADVTLTNPSDTFDYNDIRVGT